MTDTRNERTPYRRPESVLVIIHTARLDCLLLERVKPVGFWQSVTGTLAWGESPAAAALREVTEETGIEAQGLVDSGITQSFPILPEWRARYAPDVERNTEYLWYLNLRQKPPVTINAAEHSAFCWLPIDAAIAKVSSWTNRAGLERLQRGSL